LINPTLDAAIPSRPHGKVAKILHWSTTALLLFAYIDNGDFTNALSDPSAMRMEAYLGLGVLAAFALRLVWMHRFNQGASRLPASAPVWEHKVSRLAHFSIYLCVLAIVTSGLMIMAAQNIAGGQWVGVARDTHEVFTNLTLFVIGAHIAAALWHKVLRRDGVWEAMGTPWWQPKNGWLGRAKAG
jgi:cytochrome b561